MNDTFTTGKYCVVSKEAADELWKREVTGRAVDEWFWENGIPASVRRRFKPTPIDRERRLDLMLRTVPQPQRPRRHR